MYGPILLSSISDNRTSATNRRDYTHTQQYTQTASEDTLTSGLYISRGPDPMMAESSTAGSHCPSRRDKNSLNVAIDTTLGGMSTPAGGRENRID